MEVKRSRDIIGPAKPITQLVLKLLYLLTSNSHLLASCGANEEGNHKYMKTKLGISPILPILCVCNKFE